MSKADYRLHPSGDPVGCLIGALLPPDPDSPGTILLTSPVAHREFEDGDRDALEKFVALRPWSELVASMAELGGDERDLEDWVASGLILRLPGSLTIDSFGVAFEGLALVSTTGAAIRRLTDEVAELEVPASEETLPVSRLLYEALRGSTGESDLSSQVKAVCGGNREAETELVGEVLASLRFLINNRLAAVIRAR